MDRISFCVLFFLFLLAPLLAWHMSMCMDMDVMYST